MAEITFNKVGEQYVAEFEATADFNLHIEGVLPRQFTVFQRSAGGKYDVVRDVPSYPPLSSVFDYDFTALVYPKYIKIVSEVEPTYAEVVTDGEITEIKSQSKEVEIVSNGTTNISPDAGYSYLSGVNVKVNVPQEGGGGASVLQPNDVNFYDYDGTLLYAYSWEEAKALKELPQYPARDGVNFIEWNYTLEDIKKQGIKFFLGNSDGVASYVTDLTINGITYQAYNSMGCFEHYDLGESYWALLTIGDPKEGGAYYHAESSDKGVTWNLDTLDNGELWEDFILDVGETIGKADVGAITDKSYQVTYDSDPIYEKCVVIPTGLNTNFDEDFYVTNRAQHSILCLANRYDPYVCYIELNTDRLVVPKDFIFGQNYESIMNSTIADLYVNGGNVGNQLIYTNSIIRKVHVGPYIDMYAGFNYGLPVGVLKLSPITMMLANVNAVVIDCSNCIEVPSLDGVNTESLISVIIPASLETSFTSATGWSELTSKFIIDNTK